MADSTAVLSTIPENSYIVAEFSLKPEGAQEAVTQPPVEVAPIDDDPPQQEILATIPLSSNLTIARTPVSGIFRTIVIRKKLGPMIYIKETNLAFNFITFTFKPKEDMFFEVGCYNHNLHQKPVYLYQLKDF